MDEHNYARPELDSLGIKRVHKGGYRGIAFELVQWRSQLTPKDPAWDDGHWKSNYYIRIGEGQVPAEYLGDIFCHETHTFNGRVTCYRHPLLLGQLLAWHGGMTYYTIHGGYDGFPRVAKAGCDYEHFFDQGNNYSMNNLLHDACETIDELWQAAPWLLVWCQGCGCYESPAAEWNGSNPYYCTKCRLKRFERAVTKGEQ